MPSQPTDQPIPLQQDTVSAVPGIGAGVRSIIVYAMVGGVLTPVSMQAVAVADADGHLLDMELEAGLLRSILAELRAGNAMLSVLSGVPYNPPVDS